MICDSCGEEVFFLFGRVIDGEHYLLCWDCIILVKKKEKAREKGMMERGEYITVKEV